MAGINGVETVVYGVEDLDECVRYFVDFGLPLVAKSRDEALFELEEGSSVIIRPLEAARVEGQKLVGYGVQQVIWGVANQKHFDRVVEKLRQSTEVSIDADGTARFLDGDGIACGLRLYPKQLVWGAPDPVNSYSNINRINTHRKWRLKANPKTIQHVVFQVPDPEASWAWYRDNLDFRLSDIQQGFGVFARAPGTNDHHNIYWLKADLPFPGLDGKTRFNHVNYGVEDIDEVMVGANYMERRGWQKSVWGLGRHRIASSVFMYLPCPAGGDAEYGTDSDVLDDSWIPRTWNSRFGTMSFMHNLQPWIFDEAPWEMGYVEGSTPGKNVRPHPAQPPEVAEVSEGDSQGALPNPTHKEGHHAGEEPPAAE
ncbi:VOC family protein [Sphingosinicella terrae]|uniref:VOC family protein n=1 Tax=Sphingosinicella terrae TaxID=2172047 RepID=UPI000E0DF4C3|nr:VOC family protein [Sphingosinicella terrae]